MFWRVFFLLFLCLPVVLANNSAFHELLRRQQQCDYSKCNGVYDSIKNCQQSTNFTNPNDQTAVTNFAKCLCNTSNFGSMYSSCIQACGTAANTGVTAEQLNTQCQQINNGQPLGTKSDAAALKPVAAFALVLASFFIL
ncbi:uncharacterized protein VTP21DRAFT_995 [Calcarisporiella thermophila]|uniref:uncharacterized protein n=1 Tax=Calcarisporiella thermophila TaxID=911321 RepID=UPI0037426213